MAPLGDDLRDILARHRVARLATADRSGRPHVVPLCFVLGRGDALYFVIDAKPKRATGMRLKRMRNIAENPAVALVVDDYDEDWGTLAYVLVHGSAAVVTDADEHREALTLLRAKYPQYRDMDLDGAAHPVVRITIDRVHRWSAGGR